MTNSSKKETRENDDSYGINHLDLTDDSVFFPENEESLQKEFRQNKENRKSNNEQTELAITIATLG